ncbi:DNA topoisomerase IV subunit A [Halorutilales archaeon Cl-col2-1]
MSKSNTDTDSTEMSREEAARETLLELADEIYEQFDDGEIPRVRLPTRTKNNVEYDEESDVWVYGDSKSTRSANSVSGARKLLRLVYTTEFLREQIEEERSSTLRELYYLSEGWENAQFSSQDESDRLIEDLEILGDLRREALHMRPEEDGATVIGPLELREQTRRGERDIHCQEDVGEGGYQIPTDVDTVEFLDDDADFVLAVETGGMRDRLVENGFDESHSSIIVHLKGQPARSTRRIIKRLHDERDLPVVVFTDSDPWSYRIYSSVAYGSIKSAHLSKHLATPEAEFIGIQPSDIVDYDLPTDPLSDSDINALENELTDPRFDTPYWREQIELQLDIDKKAEQQSLASYGLDFVTDEYLPERLSEMGVV